MHLARKTFFGAEVVVGTHGAVVVFLSCSTLLSSFVSANDKRLRLNLEFLGSSKSGFVCSFGFTRSPLLSLDGVGCGELELKGSNVNRPGLDVEDGALSCSTLGVVGVIGLGVVVVEVDVVVVGSEVVVGFGVVVVVVMVVVVVVVELVVVARGVEVGSVVGIVVGLVG